MVATVERLPVKNSQERVAVLLNANAKAVSEKLRRELEQFVPPEDVYYSRSFEDARAITRLVLDKGYGTVLTGGGDGTFVGYVNCMLNEAAARRGAATTQGSAAVRLAPQIKAMPKFGVLKLGTGNSLANLSGASARRLGVVEDVLRARSGEASRCQKLHLLSHEGKRAPFAGMGIDAAVLNDYVSVKQGLGTGKMRFAGVGGLGYFWAVVGKTIPAVIRQREAAQVEVVNLGAPAQQLGPDGKPIGREIATGEVIYRGACRMAAAGTVPCYGYNFQIFPFALKNAGRMQLRLTSMGVPWILKNLPQIWRGHTPPSGMLDFACDSVSIKFDREMPLQVGGDAEGWRRDVMLSMATETMELIDFRR